jgi:hypothetical protein
MRRSVIGISIAGILACGWLAAIRADQDPEQPPMSKEQQEMIDAAHKAFEASSAMYEVGAGGVTLEGVYTWSRRWAEAGADGAAPNVRHKAYLAHSLRMNQLHDKVEAKYKAAAIGGEKDKYWASFYYKAEAEQMLKKDATTSQH